MPQALSPALTFQMLRQLALALKRYAKANGLRTFDSLIAATAMARGFELVGRNRKHFAMIVGLRFVSPGY